MPLVLILGHIAAQNAPPMLCDDKGAQERADGKRRCREEIHCRDRFTVMIQ